MPRARQRQAPTTRLCASARQLLRPHLPQAMRGRRARDGPPSSRARTSSAARLRHSLGWRVAGPGLGGTRPAPTPQALQQTREWTVSWRLPPVSLIGSPVGGRLSYIKKGDLLTAQFHKRFEIHYGVARIRRLQAWTRLIKCARRKKVCVRKV